MPAVFALNVMPLMAARFFGAQSNDSKLAPVDPCIARLEGRPEIANETTIHIDLPYHVHEVRSVSGIIRVLRGVMNTLWGRMNNPCPNL